MNKETPLVDESIVYDSMGRMKYHPEYHHNHKKPFGEDELSYLAKFYEIDGRLNMSLALGRTEATVAMKVCELRKKGLWSYYKRKEVDA